MIKPVGFLYRNAANGDTKMRPGAIATGYTVAASTDAQYVFLSGRRWQSGCCLRIVANTTFCSGAVPSCRSTDAIGKTVEN